MGNEDSSWAISICGLNCAKCDIYAAGHGNERLRDEIIDWFKKERNEIVKPEQVRCEGCRGSIEMHWSLDCRMLSCARSKGVNYCFECDDFSCEILNAFASDGVSHHRRTVENLKRMKEMGIEEWIAEQERKGKCTFCP